MGQGRMALGKRSQTSAALLSRMQRTRARLLSSIAALPAVKQDRAFIGTWSARDLVAHLVGWDYTNLDAARCVLAARLPSFYAYRDHDWQTYNAMLVAEYRRASLAESLALARDSQLRLLEFLKTVPAELFRKDLGIRFRGFKVTIERLLEAEIEDEGVHGAQVVAFAKARP